MNTSSEQRSPEFHTWKARHFPDNDEDYVWEAYIAALKLAAGSVILAIRDSLSALERDLKDITP